MKKLTSKIIETKTKTNDDIFPRLMASLGGGCIYLIYARRYNYYCGMRVHSTNPGMFELGEYSEGFEVSMLENYFGTVELSFGEE